MSSPVYAASEGTIYPTAKGLSQTLDEPFLAQIIPDRTLGGDASIVTPDLDRGNTMIEGGAMRGSNLFHSFQEFNVNSAEAVYFHNPVNIENILTRVTGDNLSNIDGVLGVSGAANLFFLNPNGIVFGPNATLDVNGSFFASSANSLVFRDGSRFSATAPESPPLLTVGVPVGVQFGNSPGAIEATGAVLAVPEQATLALLGGAIALDGAQLEAPGGQVALGGVSETGTIALLSRQSGPIWHLSGWEFPDNLGRSSISLTNASISVVDRIGGEIAINGSDITISNSSVEAGIAEGLGVPDTDSGNIELNATGQLTLSDSEIVNKVRENSLGNAGNVSLTGETVIVNQEAFLASMTLSEGNAGNVSLIGETVNISEEAELSSSTVGRGNAGTVSLMGKIVEVRDGAFVLSSTVGEGNAGIVSLMGETVEVRDGAFLSSSTSGDGNAGNVSLTGKTVIVSQEAFLSSSSLSTLIEGNVGNIILTGGTGNAGNVSLTGETVEVRDGAFLSSGTFGEGNAGNVSLTGETVEVSEGAYLSSDTSGEGNAGNVSLTGETVEVRDGAFLSSGTFGVGNAGTVTVQATDWVVFSNSRVSSNIRSTGRGNAGSVQVLANRLEMRDGAELSSTNASLVTPNDFTAGDVLVQAEFVQLDEGVRIFANTRGQGGNVRLDGASLTILRRGSGIQTNAQGDFPGGNIILNTTLLVAGENSDITANATNSSGGRVQITTQGIFGTEFRDELTPRSDITATSELGRQFSGVVAIISPDVNPTSGLTELPQSPVDVSRLLGTGCSPQNISSFTVTGRGGLPPSPTDLLDRTRVLPDLGPELDVSTPEATPESGIDRPLTPLVEATGWVRQSDGAVVLVMAEATRSDVWQPLGDCGDN
ncbi:beta strand repeat-containing protein [Sodalinema gerasimenkoae]|uniref:beta strand repeat-containing protein n=1 Tax=Sodalinema gerasimenkoae TaxID=2862348 RepID=UPI001C644B98|nr:S-layer family protein [Sodalinema gerasimenkoae]